MLDTITVSTHTHSSPFVGNPSDALESISSGRDVVVVVAETSVKETRVWHCAFNRRSDACSTSESRLFERSRKRKLKKESVAPTRHQAETFVGTEFTCNKSSNIKILNNKIRDSSYISFSFR